MTDETLRASFATDGPPCSAPAGCEPLPFQRAGVDYAVRALMVRRACIIGDEMGLGKTIQALCVANELKVAKILVVCPASLRINWLRECKTWLTPGIDAMIIGYEQLVSLDKQFDGPGFHPLVIFDEAQYLKTPGAKRTVASLTLNCTFRLFLSGTPIVNRPMELWPILNAIDEASWGTQHEFGLQYCAAFQEIIYTRGGRRVEWNYKGASNLVELQRRLRSTVMVRRLKAAVLKDLPPKIRQIIVLPKEYTDASGNLLAQVRKLWAPGVQPHNAEAVGRLETSRTTTRSQIAKVRHEEALAKVPVVAAHVQDVLASVDKVIIGAHHRDVIANLKHHLDDFHPAVVQGGMGDKFKQGEVDRFQTTPDCRVFIGQFEAAGKGYTLTAAQTVIFAELDWTPGGMSQFEDRAHRIGQKGSVLMQHIVLDGSIDALISKILVKKQRVLDAVLDGAPPADEKISFDLLDELAMINPGDTQ